MGLGRSLLLLRTEKAIDRRRYRFAPVVEALEDRCLLSAGFSVVPLASDVPGLAPVTDPNLVDPWGISFSPTGPFWFGDNGTGISDLLDGRGQPIPLVVSVPAADPVTSMGTPTGTVFNAGSGFAVTANGITASSQFLFATEDGTISGWAPDVDPIHGILAVNNSAAGAVYKGVALTTGADGVSFLYATDFANNKIDVFDQAFHLVQRPGAFQDATIPDGFAPFNIQNIGDQLYVTYAKQDSARHDQIDGAGLGFIDVFDNGGNLVRRFASAGSLDAPWGLATAPADFGSFGGALLVGNTGDGHINAFNPTTGAYLGSLNDTAGRPIAFVNLWALDFGNGHMGGDSDTLFFVAGLQDEQHGLFGAIQPPQKQGAGTGGAGAFDPAAPGERADYPLPPTNGPALHDAGAAKSVTVSVLLPLSESSLVLVPTLCSVPVQDVHADAPAAVNPIIAASFTRASHNLVVSTATYIPEEFDERQRHDEVLSIALSAFLDVDTSGGTASGVRLDAAGTAELALAELGMPTAMERHLSDPMNASRVNLKATPAAAVQITRQVLRQDQPLAKGDTSKPMASAAPLATRGMWKAFVVNLLGLASLSLTWGGFIRSRPAPASPQASLSASMKTRMLPNA